MTGMGGRERISEISELVKLVRAGFNTGSNMINIGR